MTGFNNFEKFVYPEKEIERISYGLSNYSTVLLTGVTGIGKTTLARYYKEANPLGFTDITYWDASQFNFELAVIQEVRARSQSGLNRLIIIDNFHDLLIHETKNDIFRLVKDGERYGVKALLVARKPIFDLSLIRNSFTVKLEPWSQEQMYQFLVKNISDDDIRKLILRNIVQRMIALDRTPGFLLELIKIYFENSSAEPSLLFREQKITDSSLELPGSKIILPPESKIITDISFINASLLEKVNRDPKMIHEMSSRQFEELVAELFDKEGYKVTLTPETRDGGKDLMIVEQKRIGNFIIYVECKKYALHNPVGVRLVRELYGTITADRATAGVLVTSSYFSKDALSFTEQVNTRLSLIDYVKLKQWIDDAFKKT